MSQIWFATTTPGLEQPLLDEIRSLAGRKASLQPGGVEFEASNASLYNILFRTRLATRVYLRVDHFRARDLPELYNKTRRIDWTRLLTQNHRLDIHAYSSHSAQSHTGRIASTVSYAISEAFTEGARRRPPLIPDIDNRIDALDLPLNAFTTQRLVVRLEHDRCTLNLDTSGHPLFQRSWRKKQVLAPLRESLAATILHLTDWSPELPLLDPMCGSGTFLIEAWCIANHVFPGHLRHFNIESWKNFRNDAWPNPPFPPPDEKPNRFIGFDIDPNAIQTAQKNAKHLDKILKKQTNFFDSKRPSPSQAISFSNQPVENLLPPSPTNTDKSTPKTTKPSNSGKPDKSTKKSTKSTTYNDHPPIAGLIIANAPYNVRLQDDTARSIRTLTHIFLERFHGWKMALLLHRDFAPAAPEDRRKILADFRNGGIPVRLWELR